MSQKGFVNPEFKPHQDLGVASVTDAEWATLKAVVTTHLQANADKATLTIADARALDIAFDDDRLWAQMVGEMNLFEIQVPDD